MSGTFSYKHDFQDRVRDALKRAREGDRSGMQPPAVRVRLLHEQQRASA